MISNNECLPNVFDKGWYIQTGGQGSGQTDPYLPSRLLGAIPLSCASGFLFINFLWIWFRTHPTNRVPVWGSSLRTFLLLWFRPPSPFNLNETHRYLRSSPASPASPAFSLFVHHLTLNETETNKEIDKPHLIAFGQGGDLARWWRPVTKEMEANRGGGIEHLVMRPLDWAGPGPSIWQKFVGDLSLIWSSIYLFIFQFISYAPW